MFIEVCGLFCRAMKNAMKIKFSIALSHSTFAPGNQKCNGSRFQVFYDMVRQQTARVGSGEEKYYPGASASGARESLTYVRACVRTFIHLLNHKTIMKKTAIQINMINKNNNSNNNGEPLMTSIEIATLTGKQHFHLMRDIRNMEPAWEKVTQSKFGCSTYIDSTGRTLPCYSLTKTECLYIATKFNDEARARLVLRWEELERSEKIKVKSEKVQRPKEIRLLACDEEVLDEADDILGEELAELNKYSKFCYTPSEIGKPFGLEGRDLNSFLADKGIIRWVRGQWRLTQKYLHRDLTEDRFRYIHGRDGRRKLESSLVWTEKGREFVLGLIR